MNVLDLFSGIGGFSLGLERAGMRTVAFCERDERCRRVLAKHWPNVPCYDDVRTLTADRLYADGIAVDAICGGFPCQDISTAGKQEGIRAERSGLWSEYARLVGEIRPRHIIVENVSNLLAGPSERPGEWFGIILGDLAALGFDAEWHCIPASAVGARHRRDRVWIVGFSDRDGRPAWQSAIAAMGYGSTAVAADCDAGALADASSHGHGAHNRSGKDTRTASGGESEGHQRERLRIIPRRGCPTLADAECRGLQGGDVECAGPSAIIAAAIGRDCGGRELGETWRTEPDVGRVAYGVPDAMDRLAELGNAVVPQIPEIIGRAIMKAQMLALTNSQEPERG